MLDRLRKRLLQNNQQPVLYVHFCLLSFAQHPLNQQLLQLSSLTLRCRTLSRLITTLKNGLMHTCTKELQLLNAKEFQGAYL